MIFSFLALKENSIQSFNQLWGWEILEVNFHLETKNYQSFTFSMSDSLGFNIFPASACWNSSDKYSFVQSFRLSTVNNP